MVIAYHAIFGAYGFWLPNDPRGSGSDEVWAKHLRPFGKATKVNTRRSLAGRPHDHALRIEAKRNLKYPFVRFDEFQTRAVARGFERIIRRLTLDVHACAILPDHVHLVIARHKLSIEAAVGHLKRAATRCLNEEGLHPLRAFATSRGRTPTPWAEHGRFVYLSSADEVFGRIAYVQNNPVQAGLPSQDWSFVTPYRLGLQQRPPPA